MEQKQLTQKEIDDLLAINIEEEYNEISRGLDKYHAIFYQMWELGHPRLTFDIPRAAVSFDANGEKFEFLFNPLFWKQSDRYTKEFVICHECLHVILNHGVRIKDSKSNQLIQFLINQCLDVVINHMLVDNFNFDRKSVQNQENLCWIDTVFQQDAKTVEKNRAFEYYYGLLKNKVSQDLSSGKFIFVSSDGTATEMDAETLDVHDLLDTVDDKKLSEKLSQEINKKLNENDRKSLVDKLSKTGEGYKQLNQKNEQQAGTGTGGLLRSIKFAPIKKKKKWETVIKKWSLRFKSDDQNVEQWVKQNRRTQNFDTNLLLPADVDEDVAKHDRIEVWFFLDTSGSCIGLADRFFNAARSLPHDKFIIKLFCFDTKVMDLDIGKNKVFGGGGTDFQILENRIQSEIKKTNRKYPEAVFVITDGYGTSVSMKHPKRWYWFLSTNYRNYIPKDCNVFNLSQYE
jgi:predicted metal-dependent peptidase